MCIILYNYALVVLYYVDPHIPSSVISRQCYVCLYNHTDLLKCFPYFVIKYLLVFVSFGTLELSFL